jgi:membrane dipeptidase
MARDAIEQIDLTLRLVESYPDVFQLVNGPREVKSIYESGKIACSIGIEGFALIIFYSWLLKKTDTYGRLHMAGNSIGIIRAFYRLGVRYVSPLHTQ